MFEISELKEKKLPELQEIAKELSIPKYRSLKKLDLVYKILDHQAANPPAAKSDEKASPKPKRERIQRSKPSNNQKSMEFNKKNEEQEQRQEQEQTKKTNDDAKPQPKQNQNKQQQKDNKPQQNKNQKQNQNQKQNSNLTQYGLQAHLEILQSCCLSAQNLKWQQMPLKMA